jgi:hypothetical protein
MGETPNRPDYYGDHTMHAYHSTDTGSVYLIGSQKVSKEEWEREWNKRVTETGRCANPPCRQTFDYYDLRRWNDHDRAPMLCSTCQDKEFFKRYVPKGERAQLSLEGDG